MAKREQIMDRKIAVIGLGYVGLPLAVAFGKKSPIIGFDINTERIEELRQGQERTNEVEAQDLALAEIDFTNDPTRLREADFLIVAVPTPITDERLPDLTPLEKASLTVGANLSAGSIVVYESTVYPGVTEEFCQPILEAQSGLTCGKDFFMGYSPERINPGDKVHTLEKIIKVVAGQDASTLDVVAAVYESVVDAGVYRAKNIKTAEAAKVIENTQRDLNIALVNELALIFDRMDIDTLDVLEAAGTKWNFLPFRPGLVGGHCIGVDPYYLTHKAEELGYHPQVILSGRRINDGMGQFIAQKVIDHLTQSGTDLAQARVGVLGLTFKEDVPDLRNSRVVDIIEALEKSGIEPMVHEALADPKDVLRYYDLELVEREDLRDLDAVIIAVAHSAYKKWGAAGIKELTTPGKLIIDIKSLFCPDDFTPDYNYWRL